MRCTISKSIFQAEKCGLRLGAHVDLVIEETVGDEVVNVERALQEL